MEKVETKFDQEELRAMIEAHVRNTGSKRDRRYWITLKSICRSSKRSFLEITSGCCSCPPSLRNRA